MMPQIKKKAYSINAKPFQIVEKVTIQNNSANKYFNLGRSLNLPKRRKDKLNLEGFWTKRLKKDSQINKPEESRDQTCLSGLGEK